MDISVDDLAQAMAECLAEYRQEVADELKQEVKQVAKETVKELRATSPRKSGSYSVGWSCAVEYESSQDIRLRVLNRKKPQLTHLLEHGHAKVGGGRVPGRPHIWLAEQGAVSKLLGKVKVMVR